MARPLAAAARRRIPWARRWCRPRVPVPPTTSIGGMRSGCREVVVSNEHKTIAELSCPLPLPARDKVLLGHGRGGKLSAELLREVFLPAFHNPTLARRDAQAIVSLNG